MERRKVTTDQRFWSKVDVAGPDECWLWTACKDKKGYGKFSLSHGRPCAAHRYAANALTDSRAVLHKCDVPACCNPDHLYLGTQADNLRDCLEKRRSHHGIFTLDAMLEYQSLPRATRGEFAALLGTCTHAMRRAIRRRNAQDTK